MNIVCKSTPLARLAVYTASLLLITACATTSQQNKHNIDPLEKLNRKTFKFNKAVDSKVLKPAAIFYEKRAPHAITSGIRNFYHNMGMMRTVANDLLQLDFKHAFADTWRFGINTTVGLGGFIDVASQLGLKDRSNDFGITLYKYGYRHSAYIQLPLYGPITVRDAIALIPDYVLSPWPHIHNAAVWIPLGGMRILYARASLLPSDKLAAATFDQYIFVRNAYLQYRTHEINQVLGLANATQATHPKHALATDENDPFVPGDDEDVNPKDAVGTAQQKDTPHPAPPSQGSTTKPSPKMDGTSHIEQPNPANTTE